jgi:meso-butanediol dehydrogenase / (S,S)-butanediol dehydrogenase / diacetyl reductase
VTAARAGRLSGKTAIITGGAAGIGRVVCRTFAAEGARIVCADIDAAAAEVTASEIRRDGAEAAAVACDVSRVADARRAVEFTVQRFGRLDVLVSNAAVFEPYGTVVEISKDSWDLALAVNLTGTFLMCKHAVPAIADAGGGSIVLMASVVGQVGKAGRACYAATKAALVGLARTMAVDHVGQNIRVNAISAGPTATERLLGDEGLTIHRRVEMVLMKRLGRPEEIANATLFLASEDSSFVTGTDLRIDGGLSCH